MRRSRYKTIYACVISFALFLLILNSLHIYVLQSSIVRYKILKEYSLIENRPHDHTKSILFWTPFFDIPYWGMPNETVGEEYLSAAKCSVTNCIFTHNKERKLKPHEYDAVVFHTAETWIFMDLPATRSVDQVYVMATMECPGEIKHNLELDHDFYNLTMTYRLDSDIIWTYATVQDLQSGAPVAPSRNIQWKTPNNVTFDEEILTLIRGKHKSAAWFVSHCGTISGRDKLAEKLSNLIDVDIYGKCGKLKCPRGLAYCDTMLNTTYHFYLSFENTLCVDYITEKLYKVMENFIIPIVFSGADLSRFVPPNSYIDANDFEDVEQLADYLNYLIFNPDEYLKYFWWKRYYKIVFVSSAYCDLCKKLNEPNFNYKRQTYGNIKEWWYRGSCQMNSRIKF